jgi:putative addiction module killer protein
MVEAVPLQIEIYQTEDGHSPFAEWLRALRDRTAAARVRVRLARLRLGNLGDTRSLSEGLHELRIDYGPGYRIYFGQIGEHLVLLLWGGSKRNQTQDIEHARSLWSDYRSRTS